MPAIKCTNCGAVLKTQAEIPPGKKVKCPKCGTAFVVEVPAEADEPTKPAETEGENPFAAMGGGEEEAPSPKKKGRAADEATEPAADEEETPRKKGRTRRDNAEEDEGDERPKKKNKSNMVLYVILAVVAALFSCCVCSVGFGWYLTTTPEWQKAMNEIKKQNDQMEMEIKKAQGKAAAPQKAPQPILKGDGKK